jgi:hypothetical protein
VLSFVTLGFLFCQYEIVTYGYRSLLMWWRFVAFLYGAGLIVLGVIIFAVEMGKLDSACETVWAKMSANQKLFFGNSIDQLKAERSKNAGLCGAFAIIVGGMTLLSGLAQHVLYTESAERWRAPITSRLPSSEKHEKVSFVFECYRDEDYDGPHHH